MVNVLRPYRVDAVDEVSLRFSAHSSCDHLILRLPLCLVINLAKERTRSLYSRLKHLEAQAQVSGQFYSSLLVALASRLGTLLSAKLHFFFFNSPCNRVCTDQSFFRLRWLRRQIPPHGNPISQLLCTRSRTAAVGVSFRVLLDLEHICCRG